MTASRGLSGEMQVVLPASKSRLAEKEVERLRELLSDEADWQSIFYLSRQHKVFPRVSGHLSEKKGSSLLLTLPTDRIFLIAF